MSDNLQKLREAIHTCLKYDLLVAAHGVEWNGNDHQTEHLLQIQPGQVMGRGIVYYDGQKLYADTTDEALTKFISEWSERGVGNYHIDFGGSGCPTRVLKTIEEKENDDAPRRIKTLIPNVGMTCVMPDGKIAVIAGVNIWGLAKNEVLVMTEYGIQRHDVSTLNLYPELVYEYADEERSHNNHQDPGTGSRNP